MPDLHRTLSRLESVYENDRSRLALHFLFVAGAMAVAVTIAVVMAG